MITSKEYELLKEYRRLGYKWIARDKNGRLFVYQEIPRRYRKTWNFGGVVVNIRGEYFTFIKWEDEEPTKINDLISDYESHQVIVGEKVKVTIPQYVADWIEHVKDMERPIKLELLFYTLSMPVEVREWLIKDDRRTVILAKAWLDGYTIEQKVYEIPLPHLKTVDGTPQYLTHKGDRFFACLKTKGAKGYRQSWTEDELKLVPEEYLKYKVEVE